MKSGKKFGWFCAVLLVLTGCADPASGTLHEKYQYPEDLWGEWIRMDTGNTWTVTSNYLSGDSSSSNGTLTMQRQSDNVIEITQGTRKYYLYASRIPNRSFSGRLVGDTASRSADGSRAMSSLGNTSLVISNLKDKAIKVKATTNANGDFTAEGIIAGDKYEVSVDGKTSTVSPNTDGENIGTVTVIDGVNFKTSIEPSSSSTDMMALYTGTYYDFKYYITNTGTEDCTAATCQFVLDSGLTLMDTNGTEGITDTYKGLLQTIEPGKGRYFNMKIKCNSVSGEFEHKKIAVTINDPIVHKTWDDSVSLKFNQEKVTFNLRSQNNRVSGVVIVPNGKAYPLKSSVTVPRYSGDYLVVFCGATADTEDRYSLGIGTDANTDFVNFFDTGIYEPNNTEAQAESLVYGQSIMAYLHKNDVDYYRVNVGSYY